jgi:hypothetical protein
MAATRSKSRGRYLKESTLIRECSSTYSVRAGPRRKMSISSVVCSHSRGSLLGAAAVCSSPGGSVDLGHVRYLRPFNS